MQDSDTKRKVKIVAEVGCNHKGSIDIAKDIIRDAKYAGADAVKFQAYKSDLLVNADEILPFCRTSELNFDQLKELRDFCQEKEIEFLCSAFDIESLWLLDKLKQDTIKVPSGQTFNHAYLSVLGAMNKNVYLSTGMCSKNDVEKAVDILVKNGTLVKKITLFQCTSSYPCGEEDANLAVLNFYRTKYLPCPVGFSDHTMTFPSSIVAVAMGASVIEHHLTSDWPYEMPDSCVSFSPIQFGSYVRSIRDAEKCIGDGIKNPLDAEKETFKRRDING